MQSLAVVEGTWLRGVASAPGAVWASYVAMAHMVEFSCRLSTNLTVHPAARASYITVVIVKQEPREVCSEGSRARCDMTLNRRLSYKDNTTKKNRKAQMKSCFLGNNKSPCSPLADADGTAGSSTDSRGGLGSRAKGLAVDVDSAGV